MFGARIDLFRLFGFRVGIDLSWFIIVLLVTWSLAAQVFPAQFEGRGLEVPPAAVLWAMGLAGALGLFVSIVAHEFGHALMARRHGVEMRGITLFIFGGVAEMRQEPPSARAEFQIAIAGPIVSVALAALCGLLAMAGAAVDLPPPVHLVLAWLGTINAVLVLFNMLPAFPLDGGRVLRSALWHWKGSLRWATRITSGLGSAFGLALIALGVVTFVLGHFVGGMWWFLIGLFLRGAARMSYEQLLVRRALEGEPVARFMRREPVVVPASATLEELASDYFYRHFYKMFPVVVDGRLTGCVTLRDVRDIPRERWGTTTVGQIARACSPANAIAPDADALAALARMREGNVSRLMVVDEGGQLVGVITLRDLLEFLSMRVELEGDERPGGPLARLAP